MAVSVSLSPLRRTRSRRKLITPRASCQDLEFGGGSSLVQQLRHDAKQGMALSRMGSGDDALGESRAGSSGSGLMAGMFDRVGPPKSELLRSVSAWPELRASLQATVVRRQVVRTQAAALHAQLLHPPPLPPTAPTQSPDSEQSPDELIALHGLGPSKPSVQAAHRRALAEASLALEATEGTDADAVAADGEGAPDGVRPKVIDAAAVGRATEHLQAAGVQTDALSSAEMLWYSSLLVEAAE